MPRTAAVNAFFPRPLNLGPKTRRWRCQDVADWMSQLPQADVALGSDK